MKNPKRITLITGHFGSGKTEFAVEYAKQLRKLNKKVALIDFDMVNPYYRSKDAEKLLTEIGIRVISSPYANSNIENPALPPEINSALEDKDCYTIFDVGGDDDGAIPLGSIRSRIVGEGYDMFFVLNERRPLTQTPEQALELLKNIETVSRLNMTGIINNTHLKEFTEIENILDGQRLCDKVSQISGLPVVYISGKRELLDMLPSKYDSLKFPLDLFMQDQFNRI